MSKIEVLNPINRLIPPQNYLHNLGNNYISSTDLLNIIKYETDFLILDLRSFESYAKSHIVKAKHFNCSTNPMTKKSILELKKEMNSTGHIPYKVILYNQGNNIYNEFLLQFFEKKCFDFIVAFLDGGFEGFVKIAPMDFIMSTTSSFVSSPTNPESISEDIMRAQISEIEPFLFLGNANDSENLELLQSLEITSILCVTSKTKLHFQDMSIFEYKRIDANDSIDQNLLKYFNESYEFIENVRMKNNRVLVHCMAGVSRSVTIVISYLMKKYKMKVLQALDYVITKRPIASPNLNFLGQLERFYKEEIQT